jgi:hypothetical protein
MKYFATVNDEEFLIEIDHDDFIMVNGEPYEVDFQQMAEAGVASLLLNHRSLEAFVEEREDAWEVLIQGELYMVQVEDERVHACLRREGRQRPLPVKPLSTRPCPVLSSPYQ